MIQHDQINYKLAKLHLKLCKKRKSIKYSGKEFHLTAEWKNECRYVSINSGIAGYCIFR